MKRFIFILMLAVGSFGAKYYALSTAPTDGDGSIGSPWNNLIHSNSVAAGDTLLIAGDWTLTETWPDSALSGSATTGMRYILGCDGDWVIGGARPVIGGSAGLPSLVRAKSSFTYYGYFNFDASSADSHCVDMRAVVSGVVFENCVFSPNAGDGIRGSNTGGFVEFDFCTFNSGSTNSKSIYYLSSYGYGKSCLFSAPIYCGNRSGWIFDNCEMHLKHDSIIGYEGLGSNCKINGGLIDGTGTSGCTGVSLTFNNNSVRIQYVSITNVNTGIDANNRVCQIYGNTFSGNTTDVSNTLNIVDMGKNKFDYTGNVYNDTTSNNWISLTPVDTVKVGAK